MATYGYRCAQCGYEHDEQFPIGTAQRMRVCPDCQGVMRLIIGEHVHIGASAMPNKKAGIVDADLRDRRLGNDLTSYKRMRDRGLQPKGIDGASKVENEVGDQFDIDRSQLYALDPKASRESVRDRVLEGRHLAEQLREGIA